MRNIGFKIVYLLTAVIMVIELIFSVKGSLFTDISKLPQGTLLYSSESPSGDKNLNIYVVENNLGVALRGEIQTQSDKYNIFWQTDADFQNAYWIDENDVVINDIPLNSSDTFGYDCRRGYSLFDEGSLADNVIRPES